MDMITRALAKTIIKNQKKGLANIIYGPRRVGKTTLLNQLTASIKKDDLIWFNGDTQETQRALSNTSETALTKLVAQKKYIVVDEAQRVNNIGLSLKILIDKYPEKVFYITGSSSLMLSRGIKESLTGRTKKYRLFPLSTSELSKKKDHYQINLLLEDQLVYGGYPYLQSLNLNKDKRYYLQSLIDDYLFKDVFDLKDIAQPENLRKLATLIAFQIGSEVSFNELANNLNIDVKTVMRYLSLLKDSFVIFELGAFSGNLRKEIVKSKKYYFWDLGIRNALIDQFLPLDTRVDIGALWENFLIIERIKKHEYDQNLNTYFFWRTYQQAEVDFIEKEGNNLTAYEFKWQGTKSATPKLFQKTYKTKVKIINKDNYLEFI